MNYFIFSQTRLADAALDPTLGPRVRGLFRVEWEWRLDPTRNDGAYNLNVSLTDDEATLRATLRQRAAKPDDLALAAQAEARGQTPGMSALAERCEQLWELGIATPVSNRALGCALAALAHTCLGPVMPSDGSRLIGVRSAQRIAAQAE